MCRAMTFAGTSASLHPRLFTQTLLRPCMSRARNLPRTASGHLAARRARLGTLALSQPHPFPRPKTVVHTRKRSRLGLLLLMVSALFFSYFLWV